MLFSIATGAVIALVIDVFNTHDIQLARKLYEFLNPGDVLLGDRAFCAYADKFLNVSNQIRDRIYQTLLKILIHKEVPLRSGRCEPRVRKRRPKAYPLMQKSRQQYHIDLKSA
ncbi:hypothetical protein ACE1AT_00635 [Pelatocladus sp. BLCC-F211]